ncbi:MAG: ribosome biogenesis GTP-binding protein YihA/YsxC [Prevotellaceae bacterium]|jgi:GTP-binding protein|nr:ribosome biogenesis GTP-binding protein YihA/YsxC [Prevotellaceae bacterium]
MNNPYPVSVSYVKSSEYPSQCPADGLPEYAFIGRSNVGKSSLINMLAGNDKLSKVSGTPGKTKLINHFLVNGSWYMVDLPGYGFAKTSKGERQHYSAIITRYIRERERLTLLFVLIDVRLEPQRIDLAFIRQLGEYGVPFALVFTKADKVSGRKQQSNVELFRRALLEMWEELPQMFVTSSEKKMGGEEMLRYIEHVNSSLQTL